MRFAVCWKHVALGGPAEDSTERVLDPADARWAGVSPADEAALEVALSMRDLADAGSTVEGVTLGPPAAGATLRAALAAGADRAVLIDASPVCGGSRVADALAATLAGVDQVWCGDYSLDRGTGSVPAFLADRLGAAQALGLVGVDLETWRQGAPLRVVRRLDGGRREVLDVRTPAVLSVEGSVASLRRASLAATITAKSAPVGVVAGPTAEADEDAGMVSPYRPRARVLLPPAGGPLSRVRDILHVGAADQSHSETVTLDPHDAAARIIAQLAEWGYLEEPPAGA
jgi:electron transfer flavoprotein beta subunit